MFFRIRICLVSFHFHNIFHHYHIRKIFDVCASSLHCFIASSPVHCENNKYVLNDKWISKRLFHDCIYTQIYIYIYMYGAPRHQGNKTARKITILVVILAPPEFQIQNDHCAHSFSYILHARNICDRWWCCCCCCRAALTARKPFSIRMIARDFRSIPFLSNVFTEHIIFQLFQHWSFRSICAVDAAHFVRLSLRLVYLPFVFLSFYVRAFI